MVQKSAPGTLRPASCDCRVPGPPDRARRDPQGQNAGRPAGRSRVAVAACRRAVTREKQEMDVELDGLVAVVKRDCPTCELVQPVLRDLAARAGLKLRVYSQDDPAFPEGVPGVIDDRPLAFSYRNRIEIVPTLLRFERGEEKARIFGWNRGDWQSLTGVKELGAALPENRPGCGAKNIEPGVVEELAARFGDTGLVSRRVRLPSSVDPVEAMFERGWTDGLPVTPPTEARVLRMLKGTTRSPDEVVAIIPPDHSPCTVEKAAVNAVLAGCKPEYFPVVLAAIETACSGRFGMHGVLCTTSFATPMILVSGPISRAIGMNSGRNVLGQGNRANATIGRALNLVIRNVGGGRPGPGEIDRCTLGHQGKYTMCFAEDELNSPWESLAVERGFRPDQNVVHVFSATGVQGCQDYKSRTPEEMVATYVQCLRVVNHPKITFSTAMLVIAPEHSIRFKEAGWSKQQLKDAILERMQIPVRELMPGYNGDGEGLRRITPEQRAHLDDPDYRIPKFLPEGLNVVAAGGEAGMNTAIIGGLSMEIGMDWKEIRL